MPRETGQHSKDKLRILRQYLPAYLTATTLALERIYIDGFAGPGINRIRETQELVDGSPLLALAAQASNNTVFDKYFFIEKDPDTAAELSSIVKARFPLHNAKIEVGDINERLPEVVRTLNPKSPTFVFLDTAGIEPSWKTI